MHSYASDSIDRRIAPWAIAACAVAVAFLYGAFARSFQMSLPWWCETPSIMFVYGLLHWIYISWLWRGNLCGIPLSRIPDCNGTWYGLLKSSHEGGKIIEGMLVIHQTWSKIVCEFQAESSVSFSRMASLNVTPGASEGLVYEYTNDPRSDAAETMHAHRGFAFLRLSADGKEFEGDYYTGRDRGSCGTLRLQRVSPKRLDLGAGRACYQRMETEQHG
jgi:hypothetical protein